MFGTIFTVRPKPGQENAVVGHFEKWARERGSKAKGALASYLYRNVQNPAELMCAVVYDSRDSYFANANDPEQDRWYRELVALLEAEPRFSDGELLLSYTASSGIVRSQPSEARRGS